MNRQRTSRLKLDTTPGQERSLSRTSPQYKQATQYALDTAWENGSEPNDTITSNTVLDDLVYDDICEMTELQTGHVQFARDQAVNTVSAMVELFDNPDEENPSQPDYTSPVINYDGRTLSFRDNGGTRVASLATVDGRVSSEIVFPEGDDNPQQQYFESDEWEWNSATLTREDGVFYVTVTSETQISEEMSETENGTVLGVDLTVTGPFITTSTGEFIGSADQLTHWCDEYEETGGGLQECGTQSAHRTPQSVSGSVADKSEQWLHEQANELVEHAAKYGVDGIVFEDLDGIRERMSNGSKFQQWAFGRIVELVTYKSDMHGIYVDHVPSAYTSQDCSRCGYTSKSNLNGKRLCCGSCGRRVHRDSDAGVSTAVTYVRLHSGQTRSSGGVPVTAALRSGTLDCFDDAIQSVSLCSLTSPVLTDRTVPTVSE